jgi:3-deoxy-D-manno-octulosonate cytidylyltransferase
MEVGVLAKEIKVLGIIPARYKSSRFPGKPLEKINGIPMIKRTYNQAKKSKKLSELIVATDDDKILEYCQSEGIPVIMTSDTCLTGTDRLAEVVNLAVYNDYDLYINIQGDEPVIDSRVISQVISEYEKYGDQYIAYNLYKVIHDENEINSNAIIKVIVNENNDLMYMSRLSVPYSKNGLKPDYKQQIPVYGYTKEALGIFSSNAKTLNEIHEDIELLRFIDLGLKIKMCETIANSISVDVPDDIYKVENFLNNL